VLLKKFMRRIATLFLGVSQGTMWIGAFGFIAITYVLLLIAGEEDLTKPSIFFYWIVTTGSTVGFGDFSASTDAGRWISALWVIPISLSLFAISITKLGMVVSHIIQKQQRGLRMLDLENHIVVIGWNDRRTIQLIELLSSASNGDNPDIVLVVDRAIQRPNNDSLKDIKFHFVTTERFTQDEGMNRACLSTAKTIIIDTECDNDTLTTALYCNKVSPDSHKTAYFKAEEVGELLKSQCNNIVCIPSVSVELMAKSSIDPGSERLVRQLLDSRYGSNQFSLVITEESKINKGNLSYFDLLFLAKKKYNATIVGIRLSGQEAITVNADSDYRIKKHDTIYYIADKRLSKELLEG
jgi:voltage-gated potassium channel